MRSSGSNRNHYLFLAFTALYLFFFSNPSSVFAAGIKVIPDKSLIIQIINFLFLIWALNVIAYRPIRNILIQRKEKFSGLEQRIESLDNDALVKDDAYNNGIREARENGLKAKNDVLDAAAAEENKIIDQINKKAQENLVEIRNQIAADTEGVRDTLQQEIDAFAEQIGEKILGRAI